MNENIKNNIDNIPESKVARWAYRLALIPILGLFLYIPLALFSLIRIGKGKTGLHTLRLGLFRMLRMTTVGVLAVGAWWFCPRWNYNYIHANTHYFIPRPYVNLREIKVIPGIGETISLSPKNQIGYGYEMRGWNFSSKYEPFGRWTYYRNDNTKAVEGEYVNGKKNGPWIFYERDGKVISRKGYFEDGEMSGEWYFYNNKALEWKCVFTQDENKNIIHWYYYPSESKVIEYIWQSDKIKYIVNINQKKIKEFYFESFWSFNMQLKKCNTWTYWNEAGNKTKEEIYNDKGNLVKTIEYKDGKPVE